MLYVTDEQHVQDMVLSQTIHSKQQKQKKTLPKQCNYVIIACFLFLIASLFLQNIQRVQFSGYDQVYTLNSYLTSLIPRLRGGGEAA